MKLKSLILGSAAALGLSAGVATTAQAADLEEIAAFALNICDAVNATGITISSADHCMKFSGEFIYEKNFVWNGGLQSADGYTALELLIEVMGDSDFGVTRGWIALNFCLDSDNCLTEYDTESGTVIIDEIGISIGNTTVLATGSGASIWNDDDDETLNHLLAIELQDGDIDETGGVYVSITHDLGNGWSVAKALECIDSCSGNEGLGLVGVVSYDNNGITGHMSVLFSTGAFEFETLHAGFQAELTNFTIQGAFVYVAWDPYWEANASIKAVLDMVELAGGFYVNSDSDWTGIFSIQFDAGDFTIAKAFSIEDTGDWDFAVELSTDLSDTLALTVAFDTNESSEWEVSKTLTWTPGGGYELETEVGFDYNSDLSASTSVSLEF